MWILLVIAAIFIITVIFGAPYVPTRQKDIKLALDLLDLKPGQTLLELGSGDGRLLLAAAQRGWTAVGYEINPIMWLISLWRLRPYRQLVQVKLANYKLGSWPEPVNGLYIFGSEREMSFITNRLPKLNKPLTLVSYGFDMPGRKPSQAKGPFYAYRIKG